MARSEQRQRRLNNLSRTFDYEVFPKPVSPARDRLAECHAARADAEARTADVRDALARLARHEQAVAVAERSLAELDAIEANATLQWAKAADGDAPAPNGERRAEISRDLSVAQAQARAAASARASLQAEATAAAAKLPGIEAWTDASIAEIVAESVEPLLAAIAADQRAIAAKRERLNQAFMFVRAAEKLTPGSPEAAQAYTAMERIGHDMVLADSTPEASLEDAAASGAALRKFIAELRSDATVVLAA